MNKLIRTSIRIVFFLPRNFEKINKISFFQNLQQYIISCQPWPIELAGFENLEKTESNLTTPLILLQHLQRLHIVTTS